MTRRSEQELRYTGYANRGLSVALEHNIAARDGYKKDVAELRGLLERCVREAALKHELRYEIDMALKRIK
jgi:hypothetical protein